MAPQNQAPHGNGDHFTQTRQQRNHRLPINEFLDWMRKNQSYSVKDPRTDERAAFVSTSAVTQYLEENDTLEDILEALFDPDEPPETETVLPSYVAIFCIVVELERGETIEHFLRHGLDDRHLPFDPKTPPTHFPPDTDGGRFYEDFCKKQWRFWVPDFQKSMKKQFPDDSLLPIVKMEEIAEGGSAILSKVKLHPSYNKLRHEINAKNEPNPNVFALKSYSTPDALKYHESEVDAFKKLKRAHPYNPYLIAFFGSYIHRGTYNVVLEYADKGSLEEDFHNVAPPWKEADISRFWKSMFGLLKALDSIHHVELVRHNDEFKILNGWHQDIKPKNILVFSNNSDSTEFTFKLADLGLSHFKKTVEGGESATTTGAFGTGTYGAPELFRSDEDWDYSNLRVKQDVDIWSLGCIYSEAAVWMISSYPGLQEYRQLRLSTTMPISQRLGDCFHDGSNTLDMVSDMHAELLRTKRENDCITPGVLDIIEKDMLRPTGLRLDAKQLWGRIEPIISDTEVSIRGNSQTTYQNRQSQYSMNRRETRSPPTQHDTSPPRHSYTSSPKGKKRYSGQSMGSPKQQSPGFQYPRASSPENMMTLSEDESYMGYKTDLPDAYGEPANRPDVNARSQRTLTNSTNYHAGVSWKEDPPIHRNNSRRKPTDATLYSQNSNHRSERSFHPRPQPTTLDDSYSGQSGLRIRSNPPRTDTGQSNRPTHSPPSSQLPSSSPENNNDNHPQQRQGSTNGGSLLTNLPHLPLSTAQEWKRKKKEYQRSLARLTRLKKKEPPKLPGEWLMYLCHKRDHVFVIDDALSMHPYWNEMTNLFEMLAYIVKKSDDDGIDMYFTKSDHKYNDKDTSGLVEIARQRLSKLEGQSNINVRLDDILGQYNTKLRKQLHTLKGGHSFSTYQEVKPLSVYIFTDGKWTAMSNPKPTIKAIVDSLEALGAPQGQVGIQFISFGQAPECLKRLDHFDNDLNLKRDIVDHCPSTEGLWKMLLGAIDAEFDASRTATP